MPLQLAPSPEPVGKGLASPFCTFLVANKKRTVIPSVARNLLLLLARTGVGYNEAHGESAGIVEGFSGLGGFASEAVGALAAAGLLAPAALPTVKYFRIFSSRFGPMPRIARKSSTLLNGPYDLRICKIFSAVTGPIPGTNCSSSDVAVLRLIGAVGGFFLAAIPEGIAQNAMKTIERRPISRQAIVTK